MSEVLAVQGFDVGSGKFVFHKETVAYLEAEKVNFLDHVGWTTNHPNPNDRDRWLRPLRQKLQNMRSVLKRLPTKTQEQWKQIIQELESKLPSS